MGYAEELKAGLSQAELEASSSQLESLSSYLKELEFWNRRFNLVKSEEGELVSRHILDALAALPIIAENIAPDARVADVGSGAGLPGIPLAVFFSRIHLYLIERSGKRAGFLRSAIVAAGIGSRAEVIHHDVRGCGVEADAVVMRAFRPLPEALPLILPLLAPGSSVFAYHGRRETFEAEFRDPLVGTFDWDVYPLQPGLRGEERHLLRGIPPRE